jgi:hypothetical protein
VFRGCLKHLHLSSNDRERATCIAWKISAVSNHSTHDAATSRRRTAPDVNRDSAATLASECSRCVVSAEAGIHRGAEESAIGLVPSGIPESQLTFGSKCQPLATPDSCTTASSPLPQLGTATSRPRGDGPEQWPCDCNLLHHSQLHSPCPRPVASMSGDPTLVHGSSHFRTNSIWHRRYQLAICPNLNRRGWSRTHRQISSAVRVVLGTR